MARLPRKTIILVAGAFLVGALAGSAVTYYATAGDRIDPLKRGQAAPADLAAPATKPDKTIENKEASVGEIAAAPAKYAGANVTATGKVAKSGKNYVLLSVDGQASLDIDTSNYSGNLDKYLGKQVKVEGKVDYIKKSNDSFVLGIQARSVSE